jgi:hypothetical protein
MVYLTENDLKKLLIGKNRCKYRIGLRCGPQSKRKYDVTGRMKVSRDRSRGTKGDEQERGERSMTFNNRRLLAVNQVIM